MASVRHWWFFKHSTATRGHVPDFITVNRKDIQYVNISDQGFDAVIKKRINNIDMEKYPECLSMPIMYINMTI